MGFTLVPLLDEGLHFVDQIRSAREASVAKYPTAQDRKPKLDLIQPRSVDRRIVEHKAVALLSIPFADERSRARVWFSSVSFFL